MDKIAVNASRPYTVVIEDGLLRSVGALIRQDLGGSKSMVVTDDTVSFLYLDNVISSLRDNGYEAFSFVLSAGEASKNTSNYIRLMTALGDCGLERSDIIIALGGGVVGDIAGFAASTYMRGTRYVNTPTTLLAAVDSSIGGKTAVDLPIGKNLIGSFWNPSLVICDPQTLRTLSPETLNDGYAESIKYGILTDPHMIDVLRTADGFRDYTELIGRAVRVKTQIIEKDESDHGMRQYLNFGHLIGHAIEGYSEYKISHGSAVALGLALESKGCALAGLTDMSVHQDIVHILEEFRFDLTANFTRDDLMPFIRHDKRIRDERIRLIVPEKIGKCGMRDISLDDLPSFVSLCL